MAARKKSPTNSTALGQADPKAPLSSSALLAAATPVLRNLTEDLRERADSSPAMTLALRQRHAQERKDERTAEAYEPWRRAFVEQVAASWFLGCVFVRTLEDRGLVDRNRIAGPGALDSQRAFFALFPSLSERDYLLSVFRELTHLPAAEDLFDPRHNPLWLLGPSAEAVQQLLQLFRTPSAEEPIFRFGAPDTRFLGDLYQDLSEDVRKRYALLQTPAFIERFILDRTLEPAIERFGLDDTNVIDPTCGSGHFLLGAFDRLFNHRLLIEPGLSHAQAAKIALEAVAGSDINPYAVAIARFRLTLSFLGKAGLTRLRGAPKLPLNVVVADSLLYNPQKKQLELGHVETTAAKDWLGAELSLEDEDAARRVLHRQYAAVVGNPPYITVKDAVLRERYRKMYEHSAAGKYAVSAPFTERFFQLARPKGFVGMITANSFMKREFGKKVIEEYLKTVNLETVINTSGAFIPGHGTPTVLLFGTSDTPQEDEVLTVLASRGEPATPEDPEKGLVWSSIAEHWAETGFDNEYITVVKTPRATLCKHPWSLGGGGATELKDLLEDRAERRLGDAVENIGFASFTGLDDVFLLPRTCAHTLGIDHSMVRDMVVGEDVRDWAATSDCIAIAPYDKTTHAPIPLDSHSAWGKFLWPYRTVAKSVSSFGGRTREEEGQNWWEWYRWQSERYIAPYRITFAFVATHNHFVLDKGGKVFKQSAPIIKLPETATEDDHYALLAYMNSSTACFWMKQVFYPKGGHSEARPEKGDLEENRFEFAGTGLQPLPIPADCKSLVGYGRGASAAAEMRARLDAKGLPTRWRSLSHLERSTLSECSILDEDAERASRSRLVAIQDDLDWKVYALFGLASGEATEAMGETAALSPESRPYLSENPPSTLSSADKTIWLARRSQILASPELQLLETPNYKRRWWGARGVFASKVTTFAESVQDGCKELLAELVEQESKAWSQCWTVRLLGMLTAPDVDALVAQAFPDQSVLSALEEVTRKQSVPFLAVLRYAESGVEKRRLWERTWDLQRREDAREAIGPIPVPPKYDPKEFREQSYWSLRGKLDVPQERFISYPGCESDEDNEPVYGWAGWNHLQRAQALVGLYQQRKAEGWKTDRLTPMLAGMLELLPWLKQWHSDPDPNLDGARPSEQFEALLSAECALHGLTQDDLRAWRPAGRKGGKATRAVALPPPVEEPVKGEAVPVAAPKAPRKKKKADDDRQPELNFKSEKSS